MSMNQTLCYSPANYAPVISRIVYGAQWRLWMFKYFAARSASWGAKPAARCRQGFHQVPPRFHQRFHQRLHQGSPSFVVSLLLSPKSVLASNGSAEGSAKAPPRLHQGSTKVSKFFGVFASLGQVRVGFVLACQKVPWKVPPRFHATFVKFLDLSRLLGQIHFVSGKGCAEGSPITSLQLCLPVPLISFACSPTMLLALGSSAIVKVLAKWHVCFLFFATNGFRLPQGSLVFIRFKVSHGFWVSGSCFRKGSVERSPSNSLHLSPKWLLLQKSSLEGSANCALLRFTCISQCPCWGQCCLDCDMFQPYKSSPQKRTHHVVAVGVFFGFIFSQNNQWRIARNPSCVKQTLQKTIKSKSREKVLHIAFPFPYKMHRDTKYHMFHCKNSEALWVDVFLCLM